MRWLYELIAWARLVKRAVKTRLSCSAALRGNIAHTWDVVLDSYCLNAMSETKKLFHHLVTSKSYSSKAWWTTSLFSNVWTVQYLFFLLIWKTAFLVFLYNQWNLFMTALVNYGFLDFNNRVIDSHNFRNYVFLFWSWIPPSVPQKMWHKLPGIMNYLRSKILCTNLASKASVCTKLCLY